MFKCHFKKKEKKMFPNLESNDLTTTSVKIESVNETTTGHVILGTRIRGGVTSIRAATWILHDIRFPS
jgi:hypothetical protein